MISANGLSDPVLKEIDRCLTAHELIKIRVFGDDRADREALLHDICTKLQAEPVQRIGKILVVHRKNPDQMGAAKTAPGLGTRPASRGGATVPRRHGAAIKPHGPSAALRNKV
jgi:RNA-binding protein